MMTLTCGISTFVPEVVHEFRLHCPLETFQKATVTQIAEQKFKLLMHVPGIVDQTREIQERKRNVSLNERMNDFVKLMRQHSFLLGRIRRVPKPARNISPRDVGL